MKVLLASIPAVGHLNPVLGIGRILIDAGHEVACLSGGFLRDRIESIGAKFHALPAAADLDPDPMKQFPEAKTISPGLQLLRFALERVFIDRMPGQLEGLRQVLRDFPADVIIGDQLMLGTFPMLLGPRSKRPAIVLLGTSYLIWRRDDGAPNEAGIPPASNEAQREEYAALFKESEAAVFGPAGRHLNNLLAALGVGPVSMNLYDAIVSLPDAYLQLTVPSFELPRRNLPANVHFVGPLPIVPNQAPLPPWAHELDGSRRVVLLTQGTLTTYNFNELVVPTLAALADEPDVLVMVTARGRSIDAIPGPIPSNARLASYLPFEWALSKADAFVTNGGYGSVNQALSFGVPIVAAGALADRGDVNVRVAWSGVGVNLATNAPTSEALRLAIRDVLDKPNYRSRATEMAKEFSRIDTRSEILRILEQVSQASEKERGLRIA